jgi:predicted dehydrogenase
VSLRAAVIGLGVGEAHAAAYDRHPACELALLCDLDADRLAAVGRAYPGARATRDPAEALADPAIDLVSIASYDDAHYDQVRAAIEHGKHVFVEKPLCMRVDELRELKRLLDARPEVRLSSNLILRASPRFRELKLGVENGAFGELYYVQGAYDYGRLHKIVDGWRGDLPFYSVVLGGAVHVVDLLLWLTGERVAAVTARGNRIASRGSKFRFDDLVTATLEFESGLLGTVTANFGSVTPHFHELRLYGTEATFANGIPNAVVHSRTASRTVETPYPGVAKGDLIGPFVDAVAAGEDPPVPAADVFETMSVCLAIDEAARTRATVAVDALR